MSRAAYDELIRFITESSLLASAASILQVDGETVMPRRGARRRSQQLALLARLRHETFTHPRVGELIAECEADPLMDRAPQSDPAANVRVLRREYDLATRQPAALVAEIARVGGMAAHEWAQARRENDFARFEPWLAQMVALLREKAACIGWDEVRGEPWDALAVEHEPGMTARQIEAVFTPLRKPLGELLDRAEPHRPKIRDRLSAIVLPIEQQDAFTYRVAEAVGFDFTRGRIARGEHPACYGWDANDVRMITRYRRTMLLDTLSSLLHEVGHGLYDQGLPARHFGTPLGRGASLAVHESQSRLWECHVGRSRAFWEWCTPVLRECFGEAVAGLTGEEIFRAANRVHRDCIRTEASEVTYDLHILLRFDLERAMLSGSLNTSDLPTAWNERSETLLGVQPPDDRRGCLQDIHWAEGLFGYFPTYTLGNLYAAQLFAAARRAMPDLDDSIARGEFTSLRDWLQKAIYREGMRYAPGELIERATGAPLSAEALLAHLQARVDTVYA